MSNVVDVETQPSRQSALLQEAEKIGVDLNRLPKHAAIIMDGNGRWARSMERPRIEGHRAGIKSVGEIVQACGQLGIPYLTLYAFSAENWKRPSTEINSLMFLLCNFLKREIEQMIENGIQLNAIGDLHELPRPVQRSLDLARKATAHGDKMRLTLALSYGGRSEIIDAVKKIAQQVKENRISVESITQELFSECLHTCDIPDPDLLIRTSGEMRVSNFLLWQIAYSEIWITPVLWPDFRKEHLLEALRDFQSRQRRYGGLQIDGAL